MAFGTRLRELRVAGNLSREQLAEKSGISRGAIRNIEQGIRSPAWETVQALAAALGVSCEAFNESAAPEPAKPKRAAPGSRKGKK